MSAIFQSDESASL